MAATATGIRDLTPEQVREAKDLAARYYWRGQARPKQLPPPGDWFIWYIETGRGFGKTRLAAEWVRSCVESGKYRRGGIIGPTIATTRSLMVDGPSGILAVCPPWNRPLYHPTTHTLVWPNGAIVEVFSADVPDRVRGANLDFGWAEEFGTWSSAEPFDMFLLCVRMGDRPRVCVTGTPKPLPHVKALSKHPSCVVVKGSTYENEGNLAPEFMAQIVSRYEGSRLGRQEIHGEVLEDAEGALWKQIEMIDAHRVDRAPDMVRIVVAVDPQAGVTGETGIIVAGVARQAGVVHGYVLADHTLSGSPDVWGREAVTAYHTWKADRIVYEKNQGGDMVALTLRTVDRNVPLTDVWASKGKQARAEPVSALAEQGRIHHVGMFGLLEAELTSWVPGGYADEMGRKHPAMPSPNRLDALVWGITDLMLTNMPKDYPKAKDLLTATSRFGGSGGRGIAGRLSDTQ